MVIRDVKHVCTVAVWNLDFCLLVGLLKVQLSQRCDDLILLNYYKQDRRAAQDDNCLHITT